MVGSGGERTGRQKSEERHRAVRYSQVQTVYVLNVSPRRNGWEKKEKAKTRDQGHDRAFMESQAAYFICTYATSKCALGNRTHQKIRRTKLSQQAANAHHELTSQWTCRTGTVFSLGGCEHGGFPRVPKKYIAVRSSRFESERGTMERVKGRPGKARYRGEGVATGSVRRYLAQQRTARQVMQQPRYWWQVPVGRYLAFRPAARRRGLKTHHGRVGPGATSFRSPRYL